MNQCVPPLPRIGKSLIVALFFCALSTISFGQTTIEVEVLDADLETDCTDIFGSPDILFEVSVQGQGTTAYSVDDNFCYQDFPNVQYQETFNCASDVPLTIQVCFEAFENDNIFCGIAKTCEESVCEDFTIPLPGTSQPFVLTVDGATRGTLEIEIRTQGIPFGVNDLPCAAIDLGELPLGGSLGDLTLSNYNNFCATSANEPNPESNGAFDNDQGVWFTFTTGNEVSNLVSFDAVNDPENLGDGLDIQLALYQANGCLTPFEFVRAQYNQVNGLDETMRVECLMPNTRYFLMVDSRPDNTNGRDGYFGIEISDVGALATGNDLPCDAIDLGLLSFGGTLGDSTLSSYNNYCATSTNEPNPESNGGFDNDQGVWFTFTTDTEVSSIIFIDAVNDPENFGDSINLQLAIYEADTCTETLEFVQFRYNASDGPSETLVAQCLLPDTRYYLLVDAGPNSIYDRDGFFGLHISDPGAVAAADRRCDAEQLGAVPDGGFVEALNQTNHCADDFGEPDPSAFSAQRNVWFTFEAPPSRHVLIEVISDLPPPLGVDPIGAQIAVWRPFADQCNFFLLEQASVYTSSDNDERLEMECLEPNVEYYVMIDGSGGNTTGIFDIRVTDLGPLPPVGTLQVDTVLCAGQSLTLGDSTYTTSGLIDQLVLTADFCDSLITGQLTVLPPLSTTFDTTICFGDTLAIGSFEYTSTGPFDATLTTADGCDSLVLGFLTVLPENLTEIDTVVCAGEGVVVGDIAYTETDTYTDVFAGFNGCDSIVQLQLQVLEEKGLVIDTTVCAGESVTIGGVTYNTSGSFQEVVPAGPLQCDSTIVLNLTVLDPLVASTILTQEASGYQEQDGIATASATGGDGNYTYLWDTGATTATVENLEGGWTYCVTVTDGTGCSDDACQTILFPFDVRIEVDTTIVDCPGDLGSITFTAHNGQAPYAFIFSGNGMTEVGLVNADFEPVTIPNLPVGMYTIRVADIWGETMTTAFIVEPEPLLISFVDRDSTSCFGTCDGRQVLKISGGTPPYVGIPDSILILEDLCSGFGEISVQDANGCESPIYVYEILEPEPLSATAVNTEPVSCLGGDDGEMVVVATDPLATFLWSTGDTTPLVNGVAAGTYEVTVTDQNGCTTVANTEVLEPLSELTAEINILQPISCFDTVDGILQANTNAMEFTVEWNIGVDQVTVEDLPAGVYSVTVTENTGCTAEATIQLDSPTRILAEFQNTDIDCRLGDNSGVIEVVNVSGGNGPYLFALEDNDFVQTNQFELLSAGIYEISVQDAFGCIETFNTAINEPFPVEVDAGDDITIELGETVTLRALTPLSGDFTTVWTPGDSILCDNALCLNPEVQPLTTTLYSIGIIENSTGCSASDQVWVYVNTDLPLYFPNTFSPNGDGFNDDFLLIASPAVEQVTQFHVFDRWGATLHSRTNFHPDDREHGWDGMVNGRDADQGVYVFFAEVLFKNGQVRVFRGDLTLLR